MGLKNHFVFKGGMWWSCETREAYRAYRRAIHYREAVLPPAPRLVWWQRVQVRGRLPSVAPIPLLPTPAYLDPSVRP